MKYRKFGKVDWEASALGFGCMRLPTLDSKPMSPNIDEKESIKMIRYAIDNGVNYVDTAYPYHAGSSEIVVGKALRDGYRQKVKLATKSPMWFVSTTSDFDRYLNEQLKKLQTDHIDFYLLHGLDGYKWKNTVLKLDVLRSAEAAVKDGRIRHIGFSFHDSFGPFKEIIDGYDSWDFCQIQYNYMDINNQAGTKGLKYAAQKGIAVIVMEPLLGGRLANPPEPVKELIEGFGEKISPVGLALDWVWSQPEVSLVLSGMSTMSQVQENINCANNASAGALSGAKLALIEKIRAKYNEKIVIPCTKCGYCMPCPNGVNIPRNFELYNDGFIYNAMNVSRTVYQKYMTEAERAGKCVECRKCEEKCPQKIPVSEYMHKVHEELSRE
jgi:predicted aldo/keto reductase-like oxidoreductase